MKWFFYVLVLLYMFYRTVYGLRPKEIVKINIEPINYGEEDNYLKAGSSKTIICKGNRNLKAEWYDPSGNLVKRQPSDRIFVQDLVPSYKAKVQALVLNINHATVADSGVWQCRSGNQVENVELCVLDRQRRNAEEKVTEKDPVEFVDAETEVVMDEGRSITLGCPVRGYPEPNITWEILGGAITNEDSPKYQTMIRHRTQGIEGLLTVTSLVPGDSGWYTCVAEQVLPEAEGCGITKRLNVTIYVNSGPTFSNNNDTAIKYFANNNEEVRLHCAAEGFPIPTYKWFHEVGPDMLSEIPEKFKDPSGEDGFTILPLTANASTFGEKYICRATNAYGDAYKRFVILPLTKPLKPTEVLIVNSTETQIELNTTWGYDHFAFPIDNYEIEYLEKTASGRPREFHWNKAPRVEIDPDTSPLVISRLEPETDYWIRLRLKNKAGVSSWTTPILGSTEVLEEGSDNSGDRLITPTPTDDPGYDGMLYGLLCGGAIVVFGSICTLVIKRM